MVSDFKQFLTTAGSHELEVINSKTRHPETVVLVHGLASSDKYMRTFAVELSSRYNTVTVVLPGHGNTRKPSKVLSIEELALSLQALLTAQGISNPILIGQSMGCQVVAKLSKLSELPIKKMILLSPTVNRRERSVFIQLIRLVQDAFREPYKLVKILISESFKFGLWRTLRTAQYMTSDKIEESLKSFEGKLLIIRGGADKIVPQSWVDYLIKHTQVSESVTIHGEPHNFHFTQPKAVSEICFDFLN